MERGPAAGLRVPSGSGVTIETRSGEDDQLRPTSTAADVDALDMRRLHALSGPIAVVGAKPGDTLAVHILDVRPASWGFRCSGPAQGSCWAFRRI